MTPVQPALASPTRHDARASRAALPLSALFTALMSGACAPAPDPEGPAPEPPAPPPPNIIVVLVDDLGWGDVGFNGSEIRTPNIDSLARSGAVLTRYYASAACTASRAQLMTGKFAARVGLENNINYFDEHGLAGELTTLPELLRGVGYRTHLVGKWHLGHRDPSHHPLRHGFDHFYGHLSGWIDYHTHERNEELDWYRDEEPLEEEGYSTTLLTREATRLIRESAGEERPLFLYLAYNAPHFPLHVAPGKTVIEKGSEERRQFRTMVEAIDDGLGALSAALEESGQAQDTLLLFASDNGGIAAFGASNGQLRGHKFTMYEGGLHVPAFASWPGRIAARRSGDFFTNLDLLPTLCGIAGVDESALPQDLDGVNVSPSLLGEREVAHEDTYFSLHHQQVWRSALMRGSMKLIHRQSEAGEVEIELYDVAKDPFEQRDLAPRRPKQLASLLQSLEARTLESGFGPAPISED